MEFQSTDSCGHSEVLGYSHFLLLFENELSGSGGCKSSAAGLCGRKCFWSFIDYQTLFTDCFVLVSGKHYATQLSLYI